MEGPSARLVAAAEMATTVTDAGGRRLTVRRLGALEKLRLFKAVGPLLAHNEPYLGMAMLACSVAEIDGVPYPTPATEGQVEQMVQRLGDGGLAAVASTLRPDAAPDLDAAKN